MLGRLGYLFICFLWLLQSTEVLAVSKDKKPILIFALIIRQHTKLRSLFPIIWMNIVSWEDSATLSSKT